MLNENRVERRRHGAAALAFLLLSMACPAHAGFLSGAVMFAAAAPGDTLRFCGGDGKTVASVQLDNQKRYRSFLPMGRYRVELVRGGRVVASGSVSAEDRSVASDINLAAGPGATRGCQ